MHMLSFFVFYCSFGQMGWKNAKLPPDFRAREILKAMTLEQKVKLLHGANAHGYTGAVDGISELGIPPLLMNDGPQGFRSQLDWLAGTTTAWPSASLVGMTWDTELVQQWGKSVAAEFKAKGANVMLGPGVNIARIPQCGRNFEYLSGEDPYLGARLVEKMIRGIQSEGIIASVKHYINNNQENNRDMLTSKLTERTEMEIYMPPFEAAVKAGALSVMCSYNKVEIIDRSDKAIYACENPWILRKYLREYLGFKGFVVSDWTATHSTVASAENGLDVAMPGGKYFGDSLLLAVKQKKVSIMQLDSMVLHVLYAIFKSGIYDRPATVLSGVMTKQQVAANVTSVENNKLARTIAASGMVLLKNKASTLPFDDILKKRNRGRIAVLGHWANDTGMVVMQGIRQLGGATFASGGGSGVVPPPYLITPLQGITQRSKDLTIKWANTSEIEKARDYAKKADAAIVVALINSREGLDMRNLRLNESEVTLIEKVAEVQPRTVVVLISSSTVWTDPWRAKVPAIIHAGLAGQEMGNALADIIFGDVNPSGRLSMTYAASGNDLNFTQEQYPGKNLVVEYSEGLNVGYRYYVENNIHPPFPFGHGLSYTSFMYTQLKIKLTDQELLNDMGIYANVQFKLTNTGKRKGGEVCQLYLTYPAAAAEPKLQLRGFKKIVLDKSSSQVVKISLRLRDFQIWSPHDDLWILKKGQYHIHVGKSVVGLTLHGIVEIQNPKSLVPSGLVWNTKDPKPTPKQQKTKVSTLTASKASDTTPTASVKSTSKSSEVKPKTKLSSKASTPKRATQKEWDGTSTAEGDRLEKLVASTRMLVLSEARLKERVAKLQSNPMVQLSEWIMKWSDENSVAFYFIVSSIVAVCFMICLAAFTHCTKETEVKYHRLRVHEDDLDIPLEDNELESEDCRLPLDEDDLDILLEDNEINVEDFR